MGIPRISRRRRIAVMAPSSILSTTALLPISAVAAAVVDNDNRELYSREELATFKGQAIPDVNWYSNNTYNFTWGLTGVGQTYNYKFANDLWLTIGVLLLCLFVYRLLVAHLHHIRTVAAVTSPASGNYFAQPLTGVYHFAQKYILLAPLFRKRHNEPFKTSWFNLHLGTLPSRINFTLIWAYFVSNLFYCTLLLPFNGHIGPDGKLQAPTKAYIVADFRGRTGTMAVMNMVPLFVCILRNNYLGKTVGVGFNTWNLFHRWIGRIVVLESLAHMGAWTLNKVDQAGWQGVWNVYGERAGNDWAFFQTGLMAEIAVILIAITSIAPIRNRHYQFFLGAHQICVIFFLAGVWSHLHIDGLPQMPFCQTAIALWSLERAHRLFTIYRKNIRVSRKGMSISVAEVELVPAGEEAVRVSVPMPKGWKYEPGTHAYLYMPRLSWTQSHPFSIAWSSSSYSDEPMGPPLAVSEEEKRMTKMSVTPLPLHHRDLRTEKKVTKIHFIIQRKAGFTNRLYENTAVKTVIASKDPEKAPYQAVEPARYLACVEGPYANESYSFDSFASVLFVAGAVGITHPLGYIRHLLEASTKNLVAAKRVKLVWIIRDRQNILWISDWLEELWRIDAGRDMFELEIYVTRPGKGDTLHELFPGHKVRWIAGRPEMELIVDGMLKGRSGESRGALAVNVCGGGGLSDTVRDAVRKKIDDGRIEFSEECFTWS